MSSFTEKDIMAALSQLRAQGEENDIVDAGRVQGLVIKDANVGFTLEVSGLTANARDSLKQVVEATIRAVPGVLSVTCVMTAHRQEKSLPKAGQRGRQGEGQRKDKKGPNMAMPAVFKRIGSVIAVASGKGGVGKSTIAVNLALALQKNGQRTGLLDADIYGPSIPHLLNITERPDIDDDKKLIPIIRHGLHTMSIGYMVPPEQAMIWRGPMVQSALIQMLNDVAWPELDILVLDMPPGTGDIQLTMAQRIPVTGALIVATASKLALADVKRAIAMFEKTGIEVIGLVENMAYMLAPDGEKLYPFGKGGTAPGGDSGITRLAALPLDAQISQGNECGTPFLVSNPQGPAAEAFATLAKVVGAKVVGAKVIGQKN